MGCSRNVGCFSTPGSWKDILSVHEGLIMDPSWAFHELRACLNSARWDPVTSGLYILVPSTLQRACVEALSMGHQGHQREAIEHDWPDTLSHDGHYQTASTVNSIPFKTSDIFFLFLNQSQWIVTPLTAIYHPVYLTLPTRAGHFPKFSECSPPRPHLYSSCFPEHTSGDLIRSSLSSSGKETAVKWRQRGGEWVEGCGVGWWASEAAWSKPSTADHV